MTDYRIEHDSLGEIEVPADAFWLERKLKRI